MCLFNDGICLTIKQIPFFCTITVAGSSSLVAGNIKKGVSIFGVTGTYVGWVDNPVVIYQAGMKVGSWALWEQDSTNSASTTVNTTAITLKTTSAGSIAGIRFDFLSKIKKPGKIVVSHKMECNNSSWVRDTDFWIGRWTGQVAEFTSSCGVYTNTLVWSWTNLSYTITNAWITNGWEFVFCAEGYATVTINKITYEWTS